MTRDGQKYLFHVPKEDHLVGLSHNLANLYALFVEASFLGRVPVVPTNVRLNGKHNDGREVLAPWSTYLDLDSLRAQAAFISDDELGAMAIASRREVDESHRPQDLRAEGAQLIVRKHTRFPNYYKLPALLQEGPALQRKLESSVLPNQRIVGIADAVRAQLQAPYAALHVRRGDKLTWKQYPGLDKATRPRAIIRRCARWMKPGSTIYLMSDEWQPDFFAPLARAFTLRTYRDFPTLTALRASDNYMLYEVERWVFRHASIRIGTFKDEPQTGAAHSLVDYDVEGTTTLSRKVYKRLQWMLELARARVRRA